MKEQLQEQFDLFLRQKLRVGQVSFQLRPSGTEPVRPLFSGQRLYLVFQNLFLVEERKWLKKIAEKSDLLKNPKPQRGRR